MKRHRRLLCLSASVLALLAASPLQAQPAAGTAATAARIKIDPDRVEVRWPNGSIEEWRDLAVDRLLPLVEGSAAGRTGSR